MIYGDFSGFWWFWTRKTKPILISPQICWGLKKQSQYASGQDELKYLYER
jgi:hypothetical protein